MTFQNTTTSVTGSQDLAWYFANMEQIVRKFKHCIYKHKDNIDISNKSISKIIKIVGSITKSSIYVDNTYTSLYSNELNKEFDVRFLIRELNDCFAIIVEIKETHIRFQFYGNNREQALKLLRKIVLKLPTKTVEKDLHKVNFNFWNVSNSGIQHTNKLIICPLISEIETNYPTDVVQDLKYLMKLKDADSFGKIILFQGAPGTGKTTAIRALAREWAYNFNASVELFLDPEALWTSSDYLSKVIIDPRDDLVLTGDGRVANEILRLIIIEDCADLFALNCRDKAGFSRFINITDGIIGQGIRTVFLLTANETIDKIDPAIIRNGRCIKAIEFTKFDNKEGVNWLKNNGVPDATSDDIEDDEISLAELYAIRRGATPVVSTVITSGKMGF